MLKARGQTTDGRPAFVFGLSFKNLDRLRAGDPIEFDAREIGIDATIFIMAGRNEQVMAAMLKAENPDVEQHVDRAGDGHGPKP